jgi:hypothetical protein
MSCAPLTGWSRRHARRALQRVLSRAPVPPRKPRQRIYGEEVLQPLRVVWATMNGPAGKRLAPFLAEIAKALERHGELSVEPEIRAKLVAMSSATIDRALAPERRRLRVKGRSGTKPGSILKRQIPIRTFAEWDDRRPGFCEVDLVGHDGGSTYGEFCQTLDLTCVATGWTEPRILPNKAQRWVHEAIDEIAAELPFPLLGLDSDNGAEFINMHLYRYCIERGITFTRSRPYRKNDNCYVEQKNWPVVRQQVGYARYDTRRARGPPGALPGAPAVRELLPAPDEAHLKDPPGRQGGQALRPRPHSVPASAGISGRHRERQAGPPTRTSASTPLSSSVTWLPAKLACSTWQGTSPLRERR